jgi:hypothetical protein
MSKDDCYECGQPLGFAESELCFGVCRRCQQKRYLADRIADGILVVSVSLILGLAMWTLIPSLVAN